MASPRFRFPKSARLARSSEFQRVRKEGEPHHGRFLIVNVLASADLPPAVRVGLVTSRRIGGAVDRNRVRRLMREAFRHSLAELKPHLWLVAVAKPKAADATFAELQNDWSKVIRRAGILRESTG